jgi:solute carrier family 10 (sodium/bile acid cotransporter), member 7
VLVEKLSNAGIILLFFLHGAKLPREAIIAGARNGKLHLATLATTFIVFPVLGFGLAHAHLLPPVMASGVVFLTLLPSTVQSSIAFTAMAGGDVAAAVCAAAFSNLAGIAVTPLLTALFLQHSLAASPWHAAQSIVGMLLVPFLLGHLARPLVAKSISAHKQLTTIVDRGSILLVVYSAFSAAVVEGLWRHVHGTDLLALGAVCILLLGLVLGWSRFLADRLGLPRDQMIVLQFCGSKKSLASGVPMAGALFPAAQVGGVILPLMLFHQIQLFVCAFLAARYGRQRLVSQTGTDEHSLEPDLRRQAAAIDVTIPAACVKGVSANLSLLQTHHDLVRAGLDRLSAKR